MFALPIFTVSHPTTIVGASELNFCVRDGNRWTLTAINTNSHRNGSSPFLYMKHSLCAFLIFNTAGLPIISSILNFPNQKPNEVGFDLK